VPFLCYNLKKEFFMIIATSECIAGETIIETLGVVKGYVVQSKHLGSDFMAGLKTMVGGEIKGYTNMLEKARKIATDRMVEEAEKLGADAIICVRYGYSSVMAGASEMLAYGTAVRLKK
jgi:uncharacterized protein YbjQ (UPF0145 family)